MTGIACAGHWVIDHIKFIDNWPKQSELCNIRSESISNGGAPFNILADLSNLQIDIPTYGIGCIGDDPLSLHLVEICEEKKINIQYLRKIKGGITSYTDVMTMQKTGARTMFHYRGVNKNFSQKHVPIEQLKKDKIKLFYLGHLLLMDALEKKDDEFGITAARLLHDVRQAGMETVVDIATESSQRYKTIVLPCLPHIDHFVINELEAQKTSGITIREKNTALDVNQVRLAAHYLLDHGVRKNVVIHMPEGSYWLNQERKGIWYPSFTIPNEDFKATCGAGDAFCSGILYGLHENWTREETLRLATSISAASITSPHNSNGIKPLQETLQLATLYGQRAKIEYDNSLKKESA